MDCQTAIEYINLYADGMLDKNETKQLNSHIGSCIGCKKYLDDILAIKKALAGLGELEPPAGLAVSAIRKAKKRRVPIYAYASAGIAAVITLVAVFSSNLFNSPSETQMDKAAYPEVYSGAVDMENAQPAEAPAASMEACSLAPQATSASDKIVAGELTRYPSVPYITVPAEVSEEFHDSLIAFLSENYIAYSKHGDDVNETISFEIPEDKLDGLKSLVDKIFKNKSYEDGSAQNGTIQSEEEHNAWELKAGAVNFIFKK